MFYMEGFSVRIFLYLEETSRVPPPNIECLKDKILSVFLSVCLALSLSLYIYIYIYMD